MSDQPPAENNPARSLDLVELSQRTRDLMFALVVAQSPLSRLRAIADLRQKLDELEEDAIHVSRARGETWQSIATALRVTRQAVHRRYGGQLLLASAVAADVSLTTWAIVS